MSQALLSKEIREKIYEYLPFEKVVELSSYVAKKMYDPPIHTYYHFAETGNLEPMKWLKENYQDLVPTTTVMDWSAAKKVTCMF